MPVAAHQGPLDPQEVERCLVLIFIEFIGILDAKFRLVEHQVVCSVGNVDWPVIGLNPTLVGLAIRQIHFFKNDVPAFRRFFEDIGIVHQNIGAPNIRRAVVLPVNRVPRSVL